MPVRQCGNAYIIISAGEIQTPKQSLQLTVDANHYPACTTPQLRSGHTMDAPHLPIPFCVLNLSVEMLSMRLQTKPRFWFEPGMGHASGFSCRLSSGELIALECFEHAPAVQGGGVTVYVEAGWLISLGIGSALKSLQQHLGLTDSDITWVQTEAGLITARYALEHNASRPTSGNPIPRRSPGP